MMNTAATLAVARSPSSSMAGLQTLMRTFETVLLATVDRPGETPHLHARLMSVADVDEACTLSFFSAAALQNGRGHVIAQARTCSINLSGNYQVTRRRSQMGALFAKSHQAWFPRGLDEPGLCLITFTPQTAELRDMGRVQRIAIGEQRAVRQQERAPEITMGASSLALAAWTRMKRRSFVGTRSA